MIYIRPYAAPSAHTRDRRQDHRAIFNNVTTINGCCYMLILLFFLAAVSRRVKYIFVSVFFFCRTLRVDVDRLPYCLYSL